jgi:hypothetical protein
MREYTIIFKDDNGAIQTERVMAYDSFSAKMQAIRKFDIYESQILNVL